MTGYTVHTGTSKKFVNGWDRVFEAPDAADDKQSAKAQKTKSGKKKKEKTKSEKKKKSGKSGGKKDS